MQGHAVGHRQGYIIPYIFTLSLSKSQELVSELFTPPQFITALYRSGIRYNAKNNVIFMRKNPFDTRLHLTLWCAAVPMNFNAKHQGFGK